jgi:benzoyl-CoA reductase/2-hydroxyglutaryl-CoA dehydratase subunit BcrC/BadD/HgdB
MWKELGLDLKAHDELMNVLGKFYTDLFLSQQGRPQGMTYFDFVMSEVHGLRIKELLDAKAQDRKVIATFCVYVPEEIALAADAVQVGLCGGAEIGFNIAEKYLPRNTCSLIKSFFGFSQAKICPYFEASDLVVGENTCDGKKKAYEIFKDFRNLYVLDLPNMKHEQGRALLKNEYLKYLKTVEELTGKKITVESLRNGIHIANDKRKAVSRIMDIRRQNPTPISGKDALLINQVSFYDDPLRFTESVNKIADECEQRVKDRVGVAPKQTPRILVSGCPMAVPNWKVPHVLETNGAVIVGEESCVGIRNIRNYVSDKGNTVEQLVDNLVDRYFKIDCAVFTPNPDRLDHIVQMAKDLKVDGVVHYALQFCTPYNMESHLVETTLAKAGIPLLKIETDYSMEDMGQLSTRAQAFIEMIKK